MSSVPVQESLRHSEQKQSSLADTPCRAAGEATACPIAAGSVVAVPQCKETLKTTLCAVS